MGDKTAIEWTDATWNPTTGCDRVSPGCDHCYALTLAARLKKMGSANYQNDGDPRTSGPGFGLTSHPDMLDQPLRWKRPRRIFVNSMSDLFHPAVPYEFIVRVFAVMALAHWHTFQVLTKRPQHMEAVLGIVNPAFKSDVDVAAFELDREASRRYEWRSGYAHFSTIETDWLPNVWLGTSIENDRYTFRSDRLRFTPAAVRFLSLEPLLGPLPSLNLAEIDWVIVGGESGPGARPMHPDWVRDIRDRCVGAGVPFHFKQWGNWAPVTPEPILGNGTIAVPGGEFRHRLGFKPTDGEITVANVGKKAAGRELDGRTWDEFPSTSSVSPCVKLATP